MPNPNPSPETRAGGPRGPKPGYQHGCKPVSDRRAASLRRKEAEVAAINAGKPAFTGDAYAYLVRDYQDEALPRWERRDAAYKAARFERGHIKPEDKPEAPKGPRMDMGRLSEKERFLLFALEAKATGEALPPMVKAYVDDLAQRNQAPAVPVEQPPQPRGESTAADRAEYARLMAEMFRRDPAEAQRWLAQHGPLPD